MTKHIVLRVSGKVQGVWFRQSTVHEAEKLGLAGTVQNMPDGTVEIHAEGSEEQINKLLDWCLKGPPHSSVENIGQMEAPVRKYQGFEII